MPLSFCCNSAGGTGLCPSAETVQSWSNCCPSAVLLTLIVFAILSYIIFTG
ncbi:hypothetical protein HMPREF1548_05433 [Clostridium sp. KLE 1755]|nr:hypothetical protein HMPREF1548_05433 [Clostridium sp. KLE 1755]